MIFLTILLLCVCVSVSLKIVIGDAAELQIDVKAMPVSAFLDSKLLNLPSHYAVGLILVGCCPGGTASNIVTYLARGNVALFVIMTAASTLSVVGSYTLVLVLSLVNLKSR